MPPRFGHFGLDARFTQGTILPGGGTGSEHGSPYLCDRHVPVTFVGSAIPGACVTERIRTVDVAPTLARLSGIPFSVDLDGEPMFA